MTTSPPYNWHGLRLAHLNLPPPACVFKTVTAAREDTGTGIDGSEYHDSPEVLDIKADMFIDLCKQSQTTAILSGAGLSTASGICDYASNKAGTAQQKENRLTYDFIFSCRPTLAHRVFAAMGRAGVIKATPYNWVQQNHDGLELRAGWPEMSNLIHGQWLDTWEILMKDNQVVPMSGNLRGDLFEHLVQLEKRMDFCISVGTSHSGLNVDRLVKTSGTQFAKHKKGLGMAMLTIQKTPYDDIAGLRIFSKCDDFMMVVLKKLGLTIDLDTDFDGMKRTPITYAPSQRTANMVKFCRNPLYAPLIVNAGASGGPVATAPRGNVSPPPTAVMARLTGDRATPPPRGEAPVDDVLLFGATAQPDATIPLKIVVGNRHQTVAEGSDNTHLWTMFVAVSRPGAVDAVTFHLHPTFTPSVVRVTAPLQVGRNQEFQLQRRGWGTFDVTAVIHLRDKSVLTVAHELSFLHPETSKVVLSE